MKTISHKPRCRYVLYLLSFHLILLLIAFLNYRQDTNLREISLTDLQPFSEAAGLITFPTEENPYADIVVGAEAGSAYRGLALTGPYITIAPGEYDLRISYQAIGSDALCEIYSNSIVNEDNSTGAVIASATLSEDSGSCTIHYTADTVIRNAEFKFYYNGGELRIHAVSNQNVKNFSDAFIILGLFCLFECIALFLFYRCHTVYGRLTAAWNFVLLTALALVATIPVLNDFQAVSHDYLFHYARINGITDWLRQLPAGWSPMRLSMSEHSGYGYITPVMYPQLFLYIPAFLRIMGCSMMTAYKILIFLANCATAYIAFFSYTRIFRSRQIGMLSSALYLLSIYRLASIYTRGALGEFLAVAFLPLLFYGMYEILYGDCHHWQYAFLGFTGVIQSHIITVLIAAIGCFLASLFAARRLYREKKRLLSLLGAAIATLLANLWFIVPFLQYKRLDLMANQPETRLHATGIYLSQMFSSFVSNGTTLYEKGTTAHEMPLTVGTIVLIGMILFVSYAFVSGKPSKELRRKGLYCIIAGILALFASSVYFPWQMILTTEVGSRLILQFLCRLLPTASLFLSPVAAIGLRYAMYAVTGRRNRACMLTLLSVAVFASFYSIDSCLDQEGVGKVYCEVMETGDGMYLLRSVSPAAISYDGLLHGPEEMQMEVGNYHREYVGLSADLSLSGVAKDSYIDFPLFYYPGYRIVDQTMQDLPVLASPDGLLRTVPTGQLTHVHVFFAEPMPWKICSLISLLFLILFCAHKIRACRKR